MAAESQPEMRLVSSPGCAVWRAGTATSRAIPDWPAVGVACTMSNLIVDFSGSLLLQDRAAMHPEDEVDTTDAKALDEESKFCLWVRTQVNTFVHSSNDVCLGQELVRNELSGSYSNSQCGASSGYRADLGHVLHRIGVVEFLQARRYQDRVTHDVTIIHVPQVRQVSFFFCNTCRDSGEFSKATLLEVGSFLQPDCAFCLSAIFLKGHQHPSAESCLTPAEQPRVLVCQPPPFPSSAALQGAVDVSLFCTTVHGH